MSEHPPSQQQRDRFELELHDNTVQTLCGVGLRLEICQMLIEESPEEARHALESAIASLDQLLEGVREHIYRLDPSLK